MAFKNFSLWRGRLPHWRADDVTYYVTFRHRRPLEESERRILLSQLLRSDGPKIDISILCVLPEQTELMFTVKKEGFELADAIEPAKRKAGKRIIAQTGERFPPFYTESFDRIVRDDAEYEERYLQLLEAPEREGLVDDPSEYDGLYVPPA